MAKRISIAGDTADRNEIDSTKPSYEMRAVVELLPASKFHAFDLVGRTGDCGQSSLPIVTGIRVAKLLEGAGRGGSPEPPGGLEFAVD